MTNTKLKTIFAALSFSLLSMSALAETDYIPIHFRTVSGIRPFIEVEMNGKPFLLMVHSNANFYMMTSHENAAQVGLTDLKKVKNYGISSAGKVSDLGRTETTLATLTIGKTQKDNVPLSVFETPQDPVMQGMLGVKWLRDNRVIVDYDVYRVGLPATLEDSGVVDGDLLKRGYTAHKMSWDAESKGYYVDGAINGVKTHLRVSTVSDTIIDVEFAKTAHVAIGPKVDENAGPTGATGYNYITKKLIMIMIDGQKTAPAQPTVQDIYAYGKDQRSPDPTLNRTVYLGAQFMLANQAVIDFGTDTLFLLESEKQ